ncbi:MAG TPA: DUF1579 family protein [Thermoanaerobaculia bacterium]|nr:DUF1579 family protein [Thermoanaerobaculia bacterium]
MTDLERAAVPSLLLLFALTLAVSPAAARQEGGDQDMAEMMRRAQRFTQPSQEHTVLERFLGSWNTETRIVMGGPQSQAEKGAAEGSWLMEGRWLQIRGRGTMLGMPLETYQVIGYDNFKMSFVTTFVSSMDTAMNHSEGDLTRDRDVLISYGTLDEYLTGEHDKMVKYVWRFESPDRIVLEVHDLPIGETGTKVVETIFTRR